MDSDSSGKPSSSSSLQRGKACINCRYAELLENFGVVVLTPAKCSDVVRWSVKFPLIHRLPNNLVARDVMEINLFAAHVFVREEAKVTHFEKRENRS